MDLTTTEHCEGDMSVLVNYGRVQGGLFRQREEIYARTWIRSSLFLENQGSS